MRWTAYKRGYKCVMPDRTYIVARNKHLWNVYLQDRENKSKVLAYRLPDATTARGFAEVYNAVKGD